MEHHHGESSSLWNCAALNMIHEHHESIPYHFVARRFRAIHSPAMHGPVARSGQRIVHSLQDEYVYVFGGFNNCEATVNSYHQFNPDWSETQPLFRELWRFSKLIKRWELLRTTGPAPSELASHSMVMLDHKNLLVYGGSGTPFGQRNSNKLYNCDLDKLVWTQVEYTNPDEAPPPGYGQAVALDRENRQLYVCGGTDGHAFNLLVHRYDLVTRTWEKLCGDPPSSLIQPRYRHQIGLWNGNIYVVCGGMTTQGFSNKTIPIFNIAKRQWSIMKTIGHKNPEGKTCYPAKRYSQDGGQRGTRVYVCGGVNNQMIHDDLWYIDLYNLSWHRVNTARMLKPIYFHSADISPHGELVVFGGVTSIEHKTRTNAISSAWLEVPSLRKLATEAIAHCVRAEKKWRLAKERKIDLDMLTTRSNDIEQFLAERGVPAQNVANIAPEFIQSN